RQRHALLADEHRGLCVSALLGIQRGLLGRQGRLHSRGGERLSQRGVSGPAELGGAGVSQPHLLQRGGEGRALRRGGGGGAVQQRDPSGVQDAAPGEVMMSTTVDTGTEVAPFTVEIAQDQIDDLRSRIEATRWPGAELVEDASQGVQLAFLQELARYWVED